MGPGKSLETTPPRNRPGKSLQLPPLEFTELHRLPPPSKSTRKMENRSNYPPPLEFTELHRLPPPRNPARKIAPTTPPSKSARKIAPTTPPSNSRNFIDYPPLEIEPPFSEPWLRPCTKCTCNRLDQQMSDNLS